MAIEDAPVTTEARYAPSEPTHLDRSATEAPDVQEEVVAVIAEYDTVDEIFAAAEAVRDAGFQRWDVHSPFPLHGIDPIVGIKPTILPWLVLGAGLGGCLGGLFLTVYTMGGFGVFPALDSLSPYQYLISGKPLNSLPAFIPVIFETTILAAAFTAGLGMLLLNGLPLLYNPLLRSERFRRVTDDRFFVVIDAQDPKFAQASAVLNGTGPLSTETIRD